MNSFIKMNWVILTIFFVNSAHASEYTIGPKGINSSATGLTGLNSSIGEVDFGRAGVFGYDNAANCCNDKVVPDAGFTRDGQAPMNVGFTDHALWVASVMISKQDFTTGIGLSKPLGVAQDAVLASAAFEEGQTLFDLQEDAALAAQAITPLSFATNMSFGVPAEGFPLDGSSTLTSFIDWSTTAQEVLYVVAGIEAGKTDAVPTDNYNGITVASSGTANDGVYRRVSHGNLYDDSVDADGTRTSTDILAPGDLIDLAGANHSMPSLAADTGTSFAAPHVTGTLALLQQRATTDHGNNHLTKKAVILNSADKIKGIIGMDRTVLKYTAPGVPESSAGTWLSTDAYGDPNIPVDREMGVGELDAKRAIQQFDGGEQGPGGVGAIGWDYGFQDDPFVPNRYTLSLHKGDFVSATLVWDREVFLDSGGDTYERGDTFTDNGFKDLDLYLVPAGQGMEQAVAASTSTEWNLEHIFHSVPADGAYELWVSLAGGEFTTVDYALAWWAGADARTVGGDYNGDGHVDATDYGVWRSSFGSSVGGGTGADGNGNGVVDTADYVVWRENMSVAGSGSSLAAVPEPSSMMLVAIAIVFTICVKRGGYNYCWV